MMIIMLEIIGWYEILRTITPNHVMNASTRDESGVTLGWMTIIRGTGQLLSSQI